MPGRVISRVAELAEAEAFLDQVEGGVARLLIEGEPGIGKTTLWREAVGRAESRGFAVLSCRPAEAEVKLSFSALADLLEPVRARAFDSLPGPQRHALEVALLQADAEGLPADARAVAAGLRGVLVGLAADSPVLVAVDDLQWLDAPSADALEFALRRIGRERLGLVVTQRPRTSERLDLGGAQRIELRGLSLAAIHDMLKRRLGRSLPRPVLVRLYETADGNPLFALEIAREVLLSGIGPADPLPIPEDLRHLVRLRLRRLSPLTRETLLAASALAEPTRAVLAATLDGDPSIALEEAERAEVVELEGPHIRFSHPLYAAVIYASAPREQRRRVHQRLGTVVVDIEERARHLALSSEAPSGELAATLEEAAELALRRGALGFAVELTELALSRTPSVDDEARQERALRLVDRLVLAANSERAGEVARTQLPTLTSPRRRVHALLALSELAMWSSAPAWTNRDDHPVSLAKRALAEAGDDPSLAARAHTALAGSLESDSGAALQHAGRAIELIEQGADLPPAAQAEALSVFSRSKFFRGEGLDVARLELAIELERVAPPRLVHDRSSYKLAQWLKYVDDFEGSRRGLEQARQAASDEGDDFSLVNILINLVILECWAGRWQVARALGAELAQRFVELGWQESPAPHVALVAALTGDLETVRELDEIAPWDGVYDVIRLRPLGLLALARGDVKTAYQHYRRALRVLDRAGITEPAVFRIHADAIESAIRAGKVSEGARMTAALSAHAQKSLIPWNATVAARSRALVAAARGDLDEALDSAQEALREHERLPMPFELGRTLLVLGQVQRRRSERRAAKETLERALTLFKELGAPLWAARTAAELRRIPIRRGAPEELTPTEERVAELAAAGQTNREVAQTLFMSPKTVEANLTRVYRKLGVHSRAELGATMVMRTQEGLAAKP